MKSILTLSSAFAAAMIAGSMFFAPAASAASLSKCDGSNRSDVVRCCQEMVKSNKPLWMIQSGASCAQSVQCSVGKAPLGLSMTHAVAKKVIRCRVVPRRPIIEKTKPEPQKRGNYTYG